FVKISEIRGKKPIRGRRTIQSHSMKDQLLSKIHDHTAVVAVIGLGYVGLPLAWPSLRRAFPWSASKWTAVRSPRFSAASRTCRIFHRSGWQR
ncbi:MAG: hypothetical protein WAV53_03280, partial [Anaerolineae bacterium]